MIVSWSMVLAAALLTFAPGPPDWSPLLTCLIPFVVLALVGSDRYPLIAGTKGQDGLHRALLMVPMIPFLYALSVYDMVDWPATLAAAALVGLAYSAAIWGVTRVTVPGAAQEKYLTIGLWLFFVVVGAALGWGAIVVADCAIDRQEPARLPSVVTAKYATHGRSTSYYFEVMGAFEAIGGRRISVSRGLYESQPIGSTICVWVHPGALGLRWYQAGRC